MAGKGLRFWPKPLIFPLLLFCVFPLLSFSLGFCDEKPYVTDELLVQFKVGVPHSKAKALVEVQGARIARDISQIRVKRIKVPEKLLPTIKKALAKNPHVVFVEPNYIAKPEYIPNDTYFPSQWHLAKIKAPEGWDISKGSENVIIAICDTGVNPNHPDLTSKLVPGWNCYNENSDTSDVHGHGTAVAGVAGAVCDNASGVAGVACKNSIMPIRITSPEGYATYSDMAQAVIYAVDHGAKVINLSFAGGGYSLTLQNAINYAWSKGAIVVAAAGNANSSSPLYPAAMTNVVAVSGTTQTDTKASSSSYGDWVDLAAPSVSIYTTSKGGGYSAASGTSFASPIVAGLAGLIFSANPSFTNAQVVEVLLKNADDLGDPGKDQYFGYGRVNAYKALYAAVGALPKPDTTPPTVSILSPSNGSTVSGTISIGISAEDNIGIAKVELYINGSLYGSSNTSPYSFSWNTETLANGTYEIIVKAYDTSGNVGESKPVLVSVANQKDTKPPIVTILKPQEGYMIKGIFTIKAQAVDDTKVKRIELYIDNTRISLMDFPTITWVYDGNMLSPGPHMIEARAYDEAGNIGRASIMVYK